MSNVQELLLDVANTMSDYRQVVEHLTFHPHYLKSDYFKALNKKTDKLFDKSVKLVKPKEVIDQETKEKAEMCMPELESLQKGIDLLKNTLQSRVLAFKSAVNSANEQFDSQAKTIEQVYLDHKESERFRHEKEIEKVQNEINRTKSTFDNRLTCEVGRAIEKKETLSREYKMNHIDYDQMKYKFEQKISSTDSEVVKINEKLKELEKINTAQIKDIDSDYKQRIHDLQQSCKMELESKEDRNFNLKTKISQETTSHLQKAESIRAKIDEFIKKHSVGLNNKLKEIESQLNVNYNLKVEEYSQEEKKTYEQLDESKINNKINLKKLRAELDQLSKEAAAVNTNTGNKLKQARKDSETRILAKEKELKRQQDENKKALEATKAHFAKAVAAQQKKSAQTVSALEQRLIQTSSKYDTLKKQLESDVNALIKQKNRLQQEYLEKHPNSSQETVANSNSIEDLQKETKRQKYMYIEKGNTLSIKPTNEATAIRSPEQLLKAFEKSDKSSVKILSRLRSQQKEASHAAELSNDEADAKIAEHNSKRKSLQDEIRILTIRQEATESRQRAAENGQKTAQKQQESSLRGKISMQVDAIRQLREEIQKLKTADDKQTALAALQQQHRGDIAAIEKAIDGFSEECDREAAALSAELKADLQRVEAENGRRLQEKYAELQDALAEYSSAMLKLGQELQNDATKWTELRRGISESSTKLINQEVKGYLPKTPVQRAIPLPLLKKV